MGVPRQDSHRYKQCFVVWDEEGFTQLMISHCRSTAKELPNKAGHAAGHNCKGFYLLQRGLRWLHSGLVACSSSSASSLNNLVLLNSIPQVHQLVLYLCCAAVGTCRTHIISMPVLTCHRLTPIPTNCRQFPHQAHDTVHLSILEPSVTSKAMLLIHRMAPSDQMCCDLLQVCCNTRHTANTTHSEIHVAMGSESIMQQRSMVAAYIQVPCELPAGKTPRVYTLWMTAKATSRCPLTTSHRGDSGRMNKEAADNKGRCRRLS